MKKKDPCDDCIMLAMCVNKNWLQIVRSCIPIAEHLMEMSGLNKIKGRAYVGYYIAALDKKFGVRRTITNEVLFGKYWDMKKVAFQKGQLLKTQSLEEARSECFMVDNKYVVRYDE